MKKIDINTNLPPEQLNIIAKGLKKLADSKQAKPLFYENQAERELVSSSAEFVLTAIKSFKNEAKRILTEV